MMTNTFSIERSQSYWRFVPSGEGKHNTIELAKLSDAQLESAWNRAFASRFLRYPEEDCFMQAMAESFRNKDILSIGSGMGFHEIYYQKHGARVTCCDIVPSNLEVIRRICAIKGLPDLRTILSHDTAEESFEGPFDVAFVYGSLMAMPSDSQHRVLQNLKRCLRPGGRIVLMLYTWQFAKTTCGWNSPEEFQPTIFARASDPTVEGEHCPWSDWHDDAKLLELAGRDMYIRQRQLWQQDLFVWYTLEFGKADTNPSPFFDRGNLGDGAVLAEIPPGSFRPAAAQMARVEDGVFVETGKEPFAYALTSHVYQPTTAVTPFNAVRAEVSLFEGGVSIGILDVVLEKFMNTSAVTAEGRHVIVMPIPSNLPDFQIIFSNHRSNGSGSSSFMLHRVELIKRPSVVSGV